MLQPEPDLFYRTVPGAPRNVNPARALTRLLGVAIYCSIFQYNALSPR